MSIMLALGKDLGITTGNQNRAFNKKSGPSMSGGPKDTAMGKDTSKNATNTIGGTSLTQMPISPSANANSRNRG